MYIEIICIYRKGQLLPLTKIKFGFQISIMTQMRLLASSTTQISTQTTCNNNLI